MDPSKIRILLIQVVTLLAQRNFRVLLETGMNGRLTEEELEFALGEYPGTISMPPDDAFDHFETYAVRPDGWQSIEFGLWYDGDRSDLTLSAEVRDDGSNGEIVIHDIHVL